MPCAKTTAWIYPIHLRLAAVKNVRIGSKASGPCAINHVALAAIQPSRDVRFRAASLMIPYLVYVLNMRSPSVARSVTTNVAEVCGA